MKIVDLLLRTLEHNGVGVIFGNPGTTEIPLVRACEREGLTPPFLGQQDISRPGSGGRHRGTA